MLSKKKIIGTSLIIILLFAGGFFYWWNYIRLTPAEDWNIAETFSSDTYKIEETEEGRIVENKKVGVSFKIPEEWEKEEEKSDEIKGYLSFYSPNAETKGDTTRIIKGCKITVSISKINTNLEVLEQKIKNNFESKFIIEENYQKKKFNKIPALKHSFVNEKWELYIEGVHFPYKNRLYEIVLDSNIEDKEHCQKNYENFLKNFSIN